MRALYPGAAAALAAGLLLGAAMKPDLAADDRPAGPQMFTDTHLDQATGPFDDAPVYAGYSAKIPDYVLGTDWKKLARAEAAPAPPSYDMAELEKLRLSDAPSTGYRQDAALDPAPAPAPDAGDDEAPPEATGDTRPAAG